MKLFRLILLPLFFGFFLTTLLIFSCDLDKDEEEDTNGDLLTYIDSTNTSVDSTDYYVSTIGDDSNNGTSEATY